MNIHEQRKEFIYASSIQALMIGNTYNKEKKKTHFHEPYKTKDIAFNNMKWIAFLIN